VTFVVGAAVFATLMVIVAVRVLPTSSVAFAVKVWSAVVTDALSQLMENGAVVSVPIGLLSTRNSTLSTRRSSPASTTIETARPVTISP
jgi:hypothetical protein